MWGVVQAEVAADGGAALQGGHQNELAHRRQVAQLHQLPACSIALVHCLQGRSRSCSRSSFRDSMSSLIRA